MIVHRASDRATHAQNPAPANSVTTGNRPLSKSLPVNSQVRMRRAPYEFASGPCCRNSFTEVQSLYTSNGTITQAESARLPTATTTARLRRTLKSRKLTIVHKTIARNAIYPVSKWNAAVSAMNSDAQR